MPNTNNNTAQIKAGNADDVNIAVKPLLKSVVNKCKRSAPSSEVKNAGGLARSLNNSVGNK